MNVSLLFLYLVNVALFLISNGCLFEFYDAHPILKASSVKRMKTFPHNSDEKLRDVFQPIRIKHFRLQTNATISKSVTISPNITISLNISFEPSQTATELEWQQLEDVFNWTLREIQKVVTGVRPIITPIVLDVICKDKNGNLTDRHTYCTKSETCVFECTNDFPLPLPLELMNGCYVKDEGNTTVHPRGEGVKDTDMVLYLTMANCPIGVLAMGPTCGTDNEFDSPIVGILVVCYKIFFSRKLSGSKDWRSLLLHELLHIFLGDLKGTTYRDANGLRRNATYSMKLKNWKLGNESYTQYEAFGSLLPSVVNFARKHFDCEILDWLQLDDDYPVHFNKRLFPDALMTPSHDSGSYISKLEMAFLKDTGWYRINEAYDAMELRASRNKGCEFVMKSCFEYMDYVEYDSGAMYPYCKFQSKPFCTPDSRAYVTCGGYGIISSDYKICPVIKVRLENNLNKNLTVPKPLCFLRDQVYGCRNEICIEVTDNINDDDIKWGGLCTPFVCKHDTLEIQYGELNFTCGRNDSGTFYQANETFDIKIRCPYFQDLCPTVYTEYTSSNGAAFTTSDAGATNYSSSIHTMFMTSAAPEKIFTSTVPSDKLESSSEKELEKTSIAQILSTAASSSTREMAINGSASSTNITSSTTVTQISPTEITQENREVSLKEPFNSYVDVSFMKTSTEENLVISITVTSDNLESTLDVNNTTAEQITSTSSTTNQEFLPKKSPNSTYALITASPTVEDKTTDNTKNESLPNLEPVAPSDYGNQLVVRNEILILIIVLNIVTVHSWF